MAGNASHVLLFEFETIIQFYKWFFCNCSYRSRTDSERERERKNTRTQRLQHGPAGKGSFMTSDPFNLLSKPQTMSTEMKYICHWLIEFVSYWSITVTLYIFIYLTNVYNCERFFAYFIIFWWLSAAYLLFIHINPIHFFHLFACLRLDGASSS